MEINDFSLAKPEAMSGKRAGEFWNDTVSRALRFRRGHWNGERTWQRNIDLYRGQHWKNKVEGDELSPSSDSPRNQITVNLTQSNVLNLLPFLVRKAPTFLIKPKTPEDVVSAALQEATLNYAWEEFGMQKQLKRSVLDAIIIGHGIIKTGFSLEIDENVKPSLSGSLEYRDYIRKEEPFARRVSPLWFLFDPEAPEHDLNSARWCAEFFIKPIRDVLENKRYSESVRKKIRDREVTPETVTSFLKIGRDASDTIFSEDEREDLERLVLYELWDKRSGKYFVFAMGVSEPLIEKDEWPFTYLEGFPYVMLPFIPLIDEPYPVGMPYAMEDQQHELNRTRSAMFTARRRHVRKYLALENEIDDPEIEKLMSGEDGSVVIARRKDAVTPLEHNPIPSDQFNVEGVIKQDIREITGADELLRGGQLPSRTTATEINTRSRLVGLKLEDRIETTDAFVTAIGRKVLQHIKANYVTSKVVEIAGPEGQLWVEFTPEDIQAEFDIKIVTTSSENIDPTVDRQQGIQIMQILISAAELLQVAQVPVNWGELFKWVFEKYPDVQDAQRFFPLSGVANTPLTTQLPTDQGGQNAQTTPPANAAPPQPTPGSSEAAVRLGAQQGSGPVNAEALGALLGGLG